MYSKSAQPESGLLFSGNASWDDLTLPLEQLTRLQELGSDLARQNPRRALLRYGRNRWQASQYLFHGPSGAAKRLAAQAIATDLGLGLWCIPCAALVHRYIGETEKNIDMIFDRAGQRGWILFFDEADALFGKRTGVSASRSRYANQEVSYLLQRAEEYRGIVILSTNDRPGFPVRLMRRFERVLEFS